MFTYCVPGTRRLQLGRYEDGKCTERWGSTDELGMLKQLGMLDEVAKGAKEKSGIAGALGF